MTDIIASMVGELKQAWSNISNYACQCPDNATHSLQCCKPEAGSWLPGNLDIPYQTVPSNILLRTLTFQLKRFYRQSLEDPLVWTKYLDSTTLKSYDWVVPAAQSSSTIDSDDIQSFPS